MQSIEITLSDGSRVKVWETGSRIVTKEGDPAIYSHDLNILITKPDGEKQRQAINISKKK